MTDRVLFLDSDGEQVGADVARAMLGREDAPVTALLPGAYYATAVRGAVRFTLTERWARAPVSHFTLGPTEDVVGYLTAAALSAEQSLRRT